MRLEGAPRCAAPWGDAGAQACPPLPVVLAQPLDGVESPLPHTRCPLGDFASLPPTCTGRWATGPSGVWRDARPASVWCLRRARPAGVQNPLLFLPSPLVPPRVLLTRCFAVQRHLATKTGAFPSLPTDCATTSTSSSLARPAQRSLFAPATTSLSRDRTRTLGAAAHLIPHGAGTRSSSVLDASFPDGRAARVSAGSRVIRNGLSKALCFLKASSIHFGAVVSLTFSREMGRIAGLAPRSEPGWRSVPQTNFTEQRQRNRPPGKGWLPRVQRWLRQMDT